jgi:hypothetical protein
MAFIAAVTSGTHVEGDNGDGFMGSVDRVPDFQPKSDERFGHGVLMFVAFLLPTLAGTHAGLLRKRMVSAALATLAESDNARPAGAGAVPKVQPHATPEQIVEFLGVKHADRSTPERLVDWSLELADRMGILFAAVISETYKPQAAQGSSAANRWFEMGFHTRLFFVALAREILRQKAGLNQPGCDVALRDIESRLRLECREMKEGLRAKVEASGMSLDEHQRQQFVQRLIEQTEADYRLYDGSSTAVSQEAAPWDSCYIRLGHTIAQNYYAPGDYREVASSIVAESMEHAVAYARLMCGTS